MKVIVVPKKGAVRGILSRPITASTRVDLTDMQIKRCINAGAEVFVENTDGTKVPYSENSTNGVLVEAKRKEADEDAKKKAQEAEEERRKQADAEREAKEKADRAKREEEEKKAEAEAEAKRKIAEKARKEAEEKVWKAKREAELNAQKEEAENKIKDLDESIDKTTNDLNEFKAMLEGEEDEETIASINEEIKSREAELSKLNDAKSIQSMVIKNADSELSKIKK